MDSAEVSQRIQRLRSIIGTYPDFPKPGILFRDIFPVFQNAEALADLISVMLETIKCQAPDVTAIVGIEARGFLFGPLLAYKLSAAFIPIRKPGKLPGPTEHVKYELEYGTDTLEIATAAIPKLSKVVIVDDLMATGGTMEAAVRLVERVGGCIALCLTAMELTELKGKNKLNAKFTSIIQY